MYESGVQIIIIDTGDTHNIDINYYVKVWILCTCLDMAYIFNNCEAQV